MAPRKCTLCNHDQRPVIEAEMVQQPGINTAIAERWGLSKDAVRRHRHHLSPAIKAAITRRESKGARTGVQRLESLADQAEAVLQEARGAGNSRLQLEAIKRLESIVANIMRATGELDERPQVAVLNLQQSNEWTSARSVLLEALRPFPEAGRAVAARLREIEA